MTEKLRFTGKVEKPKPVYWSVWIFGGRRFMLSYRDFEKAQTLFTLKEKIAYCEKHGEEYDPINNEPEFQALLRSLETAYFAGLKGDKILALQLWCIENYELIGRYKSGKVARYAQIPRGLASDIQKAIKLASYVNVMHKRYAMYDKGINGPKL